MSRKTQEHFVCQASLLKLSAWHIYICCVVFRIIIIICLESNLQRVVRLSKPICNRFCCFLIAFHFYLTDSSESVVCMFVCVNALVCIFCIFCVVIIELKTFYLLLHFLFYLFVVCFYFPTRECDQVNSREERGN